MNALNRSNNGDVDTFIFRFTNISDNINPKINLASHLNLSIIQSDAIISLSISDLISGTQEILYNWDSNINTSLTSPFEITPPSGDGSHILNIYSRDFANNWTNQTFVLIVDDSNPLISLTILVNGSIQPSGTLIPFEISDLNSLNRVFYRWSDATNLTSWIEPYEVSFPVIEGNHILEIFAEDIAGNWSNETYSFIVDNTKPDIQLQDILPNSVHHSETPIKLDITDTNGIQEVIVNWDNGQNSTLSFPYETFLPATQIQHFLTIFAQDLALHWKVVNFNFTTDDNSPVISLVNLKSNSSLMPNIPIQLNVFDIHLDEVLYIWNVDASNSSLDSSNTILAPSTEGEYILTIYAVDDATNWATETFSFIIDGTPPKPSIVGIIEGVEYFNTRQIHILDALNENDYERVEIYVDGIVVYNETEEPFSWDWVTNDFENGRHVVQIVVYDKAGNKFTKTYNVSIDNSTQGRIKRVIRDNLVLITISISDFSLIVLVYWLWQRRNLIILMTSANPKKDHFLDVDGEVNAVNEATKKEKHGKKFKLERWPKTKALDVPRKLREHEPHIFHFSGHGGYDDDGIPDGSLILVGKDGKPEKIDIDGVINWFKTSGKRIRVIVLNACWSKDLADRLTQHVDFVVGMREEIFDNEARVFSVGFYSRLADGQTLQQAYDGGIADMDLVVKRPEFIPILSYNKEKLDPKNVKIFKKYVFF
jgi:hypothetical protein